MSKSKRVQIECMDFAGVIDMPGKAFLYLDPPYYDKGSSLYQHSFAPEDHNRLAWCLQMTRNRWLLSYDDCPEILALYREWATIRRVTVTHTLSTRNSKDSYRKKSELLIASDPGVFHGSALQ